jgi:hypothetical protein
MNVLVVETYLTCIKLPNSQLEPMHKLSEMLTAKGECINYSSANG